MSKAASKTISSSTRESKSKQEPSSTQINLQIYDEIKRLAGLLSIDSSVLEEFAMFVINNYKLKPPKPPKPPKPLTLAQLKSAIFQHFSVKNLTELRKSSGFKMATDGMDNLNLAAKEGWEKLYRKFIGVLPGEENQQGYGCINGINIFNYFKPWQVFGLDGKIASAQDVRNAYYALSKIYHPDVPITGDVAIFDRITTMYKSISAEA